jgi:hypothetical protein
MRVSHQNICLVLVALGLLQNRNVNVNVNAFTAASITGASRTNKNDRSYFGLSSASSDDDASSPTPAQQLLDKAAQLRAEIAAMEGKTVSQVETEARVKKETQVQRTQQQDLENAERKKNAVSDRLTDGRFLDVPVTFDDMVRQAARAVERAFQDGKTRQTVRFNLVGEDQSAMEENEFPGGSRQLYREAGNPLTTALLRELRAPTKDVDQPNNDQRRLAPTLSAQNIWDFDGSALHTAQAKEGPSADIRALVFANTDSKYINDIEKLSADMGPRLFLLVNPFWRNVDSWSFNLLAPNDKKRAQQVIFDNGYDETYVTLIFQVRGEKCVALKAYPYDWQLFAFWEDENNYNTESVIRLGSCQEEPTSAIVTELLNNRPEFKETKTMRQMKKLF